MNTKAVLICKNAWAQAKMQGKTCSILLCALIFLWSTQVIYGYTGPYIHGNNQGKRKRGDIMQKVQWHWKDYWSGLYLGFILWVEVPSGPRLPSGVRGITGKFFERNMSGGRKAGTNIAKQHRITNKHRTE